MKGTTAEQVRQQIASFNPEQKAAVLQLIPQIVDTTLHHLLFTLDQEPSLRLTMIGPGTPAENVRDLSDGLTGEPFGNHGWIAKFSTKSKEQS